MSPSPPLAGTAERRPELLRLLRDLGPRLQRGARIDPARAGRVLCTGIPELDRQLGGGFAAGRLGELCGPPSSGRTSLALALLARATASGALVAVVDGADAFHPDSAAAAGVCLERVLWARPPGIREALRCCERLLGAQGFAAVLLDTAGNERQWGAQPTASWQRLARAGAASGNTLLVLSERRVTGSQADLALELRPTRARFDGSPCLFDGLEIEAAVSRSRRAPDGGPTPLQLRADPAA